MCAVMLQSAASQSQHVVNILTSGDPVNAQHVSAAAKNEKGADGQVPKDGAAATVQVHTQDRHCTTLHCMHNPVLA